MWQHTSKCVKPSLHADVRRKQRNVDLKLIAKQGSIFLDVLSAQSVLLLRIALAAATLL
jgi:hypothetical protein